jgi:DNA-binding response OmpR family regulator
MVGELAVERDVEEPELEIDEADARLTQAGEPVPLAPKPFAVLCALARTPRTRARR